MGGLGNQMFQYACGRSKAIQLKTDIRVDTRMLENSIVNKNITAREFELDIFKANINIAHKKELAAFSPTTIPLKIWYRWLKSYRIYVEPSFEYDNFFEALKGNMLICGYWQTEKYFLHLEKIIREDFTFILPKNNQTLALEDRIDQTNAVSIHVRRGDYVSLQSANSFHGVANLRYYKAAILLLEKRINNAMYFVFSDDTQWVKENLIGDRKDMIAVEHNNGKDSWQDMYLMSRCKHNIIANSSFSWWGAWLNNYQQKIVIAPTQWFARDENNNKTHDLIPPSWLKL